MIVLQLTILFYDNSDILDCNCWLMYQLCSFSIIFWIGVWGCFSCWWSNCWMFPIFSLQFGWSHISLCIFYSWYWYLYIYSTNYTNEIINEIIYSGVSWINYCLVAAPAAALPFVYKANEDYRRSNLDKNSVEDKCPLISQSEDEIASQELT